ncbi:shikimate dehydrogenase [Desulfovibrio sp. OttesenSCG-928-O18]|nr:shikimate dehydrogenase [Desulfovibrio sp. OttesenSCG-928-O18]
MASERSSVPPEHTFGVCGYPLGQSLSPALHTWAFARTGIAAAYTSWETPPAELPAFVTAFRKRPYGGASVTIPHKQNIVAFLDGVTDTATSIGAVNTLFWKNDALFGHNTDMEGFLAPLAAEALPAAALILGAGGAARAVLAGLAHLGISRVILAARTTEKAEQLARDYCARFASLSVIAWEDRENIPAAVEGGLWVVNTTPLGMRGKAEGLSPLSGAAFARARDAGACLAYDLVYNPLRTAFLDAAMKAGWTVRDGLDMFVAQGAAQFRLWTGQDMPVRDARAFLLTHLEP